MKPVGPTIIAIAACLAGPLSGSQAQMLRCEAADVVVHFGDASHAPPVCEAVHTAVELFDRCGALEFSEPLVIELVDELEPGCMAIFHCGTDRIEVLSPPMMDLRGDDHGVFGFLPTDAYFQSVIVHELAHAAIDDLPCPFAACLATQEYIAYGLQIMSLAPQDQRRFADGAALGEAISREDISAILLMMAPGRFAQMTWAHLSQRPDSCGFIGQLSRGEILLDRERF